MGSEDEHPSADTQKQQKEQDEGQTMAEPLADHSSQNPLNHTGDKG